MTSYNLGQVAVLSRGAYTPGTAYIQLNVVSHLGGSFLCKQNCTNVEPGVTSGWETYWMSMASGIKTYSITDNNGTATVSITFTDGSTYSTTYSTAVVGANSVNTGNIVDGAVTGAKLGTGSVTKEKIADLNVSGNLWAVYVTSSAPGSSSSPGIYLVYGS